MREPEQPWMRSEKMSQCEDRDREISRAKEKRKWRKHKRESVGYFFCEESDVVCTLFVSSQNPFEFLSAFLHH